MKIASAEGSVQTNIEDADDYVVSTSAKMYEIMYHSIYSDAVAAVVREIASNAHDSHVQAGKEAEPFRVVLPNTFRPFFEVEDFGVGMTEAQVMKVYKSYGESTKAGTNDLVGGFGLGSKTPFAYSTSFDTRVRKDGLETTYMNYIGDDGKPKLKKLVQTKTDQPNGVKVSVAVKPEDFNLFKKAAEHYLSFYKTRPAVVGADFKFEIPEAEIVQFYKYGIGKLGTKLNDQYVVMGSVPYPASGLVTSALNGRSLIVPIGFLRPTASREALDFTDESSIAALSALATEKLNAAEEGILSELCSSRRLVSKLSALRNTRAMMFLDDIVWSKIFTPREVMTFNRFAQTSFRTSHRNVITNQHDLRRYIESNASIVVLYGGASSYKRTIAYNVARKDPKYQAVIVSRAHTRLEKVMQKVFPDGEVGVVWKTFDEMYASRPRKKAPAHGPTHMTGMLVVSGQYGVTKVNVSDVDPKKANIVFTNRWASSSSQYKVRAMMRIRYSDVMDTTVLIKPTKANRKFFAEHPEIKTHDLDTWTTTATDTSQLVLYAATSANDTNKFFNVMKYLQPILARNETVDDLPDGIVTKAQEITNALESNRNLPIIGLDSISNYRAVHADVENTMNTVVEWYNDCCGKFSMLKYIQPWEFTNNDVIKDIDRYINP